jgi:hypothetical protein
MRANPGAPDIRFVFSTDLQNSKVIQELEKAQPDNRVFFVEFVNAPMAQNLRQGFSSTRSAYTEKVFADYAGRPTTTLFLPKVRDAKIHDAQP